MKPNLLELLRHQRENCVKEYESYYAGSKEDFTPQCIIDSIRNAAIPTPIGTFCEKCRKVICNCEEYKKIVSEIKQKMIDSRNPDNKTKRTADYRIGLKTALDIVNKTIFENEKNETKKI